MVTSLSQTPFFFTEYILCTDEDDDATIDNEQRGWPRAHATERVLSRPDVTLVTEKRIAYLIALRCFLVVGAPLSHPSLFLYIQGTR